VRPRAVETEPPFYQGVPILENLRLNVRVASSGPLSIKNNIATVQVAVPKLIVLGTLANPSLDGSIVVEEGGTFKPPLQRAEFVTDRGSINFQGTKQFPDETPIFDLNAWSDWSDRYEQLHHITLQVTGTYREAYIDLRSPADGWDKSQVLSALLTGGAPDDLRRSFQQTPTSISAGPRPAQSGSNALLQTASGELFGTLIEDPLKNVFGLDVLRVEIGYVRLCKYNRRLFKLCGTGEGQLSPTSRYDVRSELKLSDDLAAVGALERIERGIERAEEVITRGKLQLRLKLPIY
jgi:hypothetical protein